MGKGHALALNHLVKMNSCPDHTISPFGSNLTYMDNISHKAYTVTLSCFIGQKLGHSSPF